MPRKNSFTAANILLPEKDFDKWAVIACDQFTSQKEYWLETKKIANVLEAPVMIVLLLLVTAYLVDGSFSPFLYFRF